MKLIIAAAVLLILNLICFLLMRHDKQLAKKGGRRIPERTLFISAGCFGALGGTIAMYLFHHKTKHWTFKTFFPLMMILQIVIIGWVTWRFLI